MLPKSTLLPDVAQNEIHKFSLGPFTTKCYQNPHYSKRFNIMMNWVYTNCPIVFNVCLQTELNCITWYPITWKNGTKRSYLRRNLRAFLLQHNNNLKSIEILSFHTHTKSSGMDTVQINILPLSRDNFLKMQAACFSETLLPKTRCYSNLDHIVSSLPWKTDVENKNIYSQT